MSEAIQIRDTDVTPEEYIRMVTLTWKRRLEGNALYIPRRRELVQLTKLALSLALIEMMEVLLSPNATVREKVEAATVISTIERLNLQRVALDIQRDARLGRAESTIVIRQLDEDGEREDRA
ncbi:MAG: hypothetical protein QXO86_01320 [Nitrososphaerota archaeon]